MTTIDAARRVAVLSDVHGNAIALSAVLAELATEPPDLVVFGGDLTWGPLPRETLDLVRSLDLPVAFVRGNADRTLIEPPREPSDRETWLREQHTGDDLALLGSFQEALVVDVDGLGPTRLCHGSPRSDEEIVTPETPEARMTALSAGIPERVLVTAHTHLQFDRRVVGLRSVNAGSVGLPYEGRHGAYWALLGPDVEHRRTEYAVDEAVAAYRATGFPRIEELVEMLVAPMTREELIAHAEPLEFSG